MLIITYTPFYFNSSSPFLIINPFTVTYFRFFNYINGDKSLYFSLVLKNDMSKTSNCLIFNICFKCTAEQYLQLRFVKYLRLYSGSNVVTVISSIFRLLRYLTSDNKLKSLIFCLLILIDTI